MRIAIESFRGEAPRVTPRALPDNAAQTAINSRLQSGDLETWRQFATIKNLANSGDVKTIYLLNGSWLSWEEDVDVARGPIPGDDTFRTYLTGPEVYDQPRFTNYALATTGAEPFPVTTRPLGVPNPDAQPTAVPGVSTLSNPATIDIIDSGDQFSTAWSANSPVNTTFTRAIASQDAAVGNGLPSYSLQVQENTQSPCWMLRDFGVGDSQVLEYSFDFAFNVGTQKRMWAGVLVDALGSGLGVHWNETGAFQIGLLPSVDIRGFSPLTGTITFAPGDSVFYTCTVQVIANPQGTRTVTATLYQGSGQIATITATNAFTNRGGFMSFMNQISESGAPDKVTWYDNLSIRATPPTATIEQVATSYVYTFVNDLGEESGPSPPSATLLKDDGTAITVTSATAVQSGFSVDYGVTTKRIYRAASGATGTAFLFVAEIPLGQAEYVDELTDSELGDPIETELYALPPDDLRGILALPNGVMVGFSRNQLCFSAQNRPHAWPIQWRLNTDTAIVGIGNIDNTVVIGTEAFPYLALGNDPSAYSMSKLEKQQACVAKRSVAHLTGIGVVFASPDGLVAVSSNGQVGNITEQIFTRRQWQTNSPETIIGVVHDEVYHFFTQDPSVPSALSVAEYKSYALDMKSTGFGLIELGYHALAAYSDPLTDKLYLVLDALDEPFEQYLPLPSTAPAVATSTPDDAVLRLTFDNALVPFEDTSPNALVPAVIGAWTQANGIISTNQANATWQILFNSTPVLGYDTSLGFTLEVRAALTTSPGIGGDSIFPARYTLPADTFSFEFRTNGAGTTARWYFNAPSVSGVQVGSDFPLQTFQHAAMVVPPGTSPTVRVYIEGVLVGSFPITLTGAVTSATMELVRIAHSIVTGFSVDYLRLTAGQLYTTDFTPPELGAAGFKTIYEFDSEFGDGDLTQRWKGKFNLLAYPATFEFCQVKAQDYTNLLINFYADGVLIKTHVVTSVRPFRLPLTDRYETFEIEVVGTSRVRTIQVAEDIRELT